MPCLLQRTGAGSSYGNDRRAVTVNVWNLDQSIVDRSLLEVSMDDEADYNTYLDSAGRQDLREIKPEVLGRLERVDSVLSTAVTVNVDDQSGIRGNPTCDKVFGCTELHEHILIHAAPRDILRAQRVAKSWRHTITTSPSIRQALFLEPVKPTMAWTHSKQPCKSSGAGRDGLFGPAPTLMLTESLLPLAEAEAQGVEYIIQAKVNSLLPYRHLHFAQSLDSSHATWAFCNYVHPQGPPPDTAFCASIDAIKRVNPEHQGMFLSQPPAKRVEVCVYGGRYRALVEKLVCKHDVGVTLRQMLEAIMGVQAGNTVRCTEFALWMRDVTFATG